MSGRRKAPSSDDRPRPFPAAGPLVAIDWGEKRIGLAISDPQQTVAHPLATLTRRAGRRFPLGKLRLTLESHAPVGIVMGLPLDPSGAEGPGARRARVEGTLVQSKTGLPLVFWDERMTTARVLSAIQELGGTPADRREAVDPLAATVLLQSFLDAHRS